MYELQYKKKAIKALAKINDPYYTNIIEAIDQLAENPRPNGYKKLTGRDGYRVGVDTYRILYSIFDTTMVIEIVNIGVRVGFMRIENKIKTYKTSKIYS